MSIQTFILNLFPRHYELQEDLKSAKENSVRAQVEAGRLRCECQSLASQLNSSHTEVYQLRRELQAEKLRNELPCVFLTKDQILKLMAFSKIDPNIHRELEHAYEKHVELQLRKERQSDSF